jgi:transposase InsO family protein
MRLERPPPRVDRLSTAQLGPPIARHLHNELPRRRFQNRGAAHMAIFEFVEAWYNPHRHHRALDGPSPINYQRLQPTPDSTANPASSIETE